MPLDGAAPATPGGDFPWLLLLLGFGTSGPSSEGRGEDGPDDGAAGVLAWSPPPTLPDNGAAATIPVPTTVPDGAWLATSQPALVVFASQMGLMLPAPAGVATIPVDGHEHPGDGQDRNPGGPRLDDALIGSGDAATSLPAPSLAPVQVAAGGISVVAIAHAEPATAGARASDTATDDPAESIAPADLAVPAGRERRSPARAAVPTLGAEAALQPAPSRAAAATSGRVDAPDRTVPAPTPVVSAAEMPEAATGAPPRPTPAPAAPAPVGKPMIRTAETRERATVVPARIESAPAFGVPPVDRPAGRVTDPGDGVVTVPDPDPSALPDSRHVALPAPSRSALPRNVVVAVTQPRVAARAHGEPQRLVGPAVVTEPRPVVVADVTPSRDARDTTLLRIEVPPAEMAAEVKPSLPAHRPLVARSGRWPEARHHALSSMASVVATGAGETESHPANQVGPLPVGRSTARALHPPAGREAAPAPARLERPASAQGPASPERVPESVAVGQAPFVIEPGRLRDPIENVAPTVEPAVPRAVVAQPQTTDGSEPGAAAAPTTAITRSPRIVSLDAPRARPAVPAPSLPDTPERVTRNHASADVRATDRTPTPRSGVESSGPSRVPVRSPSIEGVLQDAPAIASAEEIVPAPPAATSERADTIRHVPAQEPTLDPDPITPQLTSHAIAPAPSIARPGPESGPAAGGGAGDGLSPAVARTTAGPGDRGQSDSRPRAGTGDRRDARPAAEPVTTSAAARPAGELAPMTLARVAAPAAPAEPARAVAPAPLAWQVVEAARVVVAEGATRIDVRLDPPALGAVRVTASTANDGSVSLQIAAERDDTRALLVQAIPEIQRLLVDRGVPAASVAVAPVFDPPAERRAPGRRDPEWTRDRREAPADSRRLTPARRRVGLVDLTV